MKRWLIILACLVSTHSVAEKRFYISFDEDGRTTWSTIPEYGDDSQSGREIEDDAAIPMLDEPVAKPKMKKARPAVAKAVKTPEDFPGIAMNVQKDRDGERYRIIANELKDEESALQLAHAKNDDNFIKLRQANVAALRRELTSFRK
jgi:hypothetical protein